jgi:hypothetical protein
MRELHDILDQKGVILGRREEEFIDHVAYSLFIASAVGMQSRWRHIPPVNEAVLACSSPRRTR